MSELAHYKSNRDCRAGEIIGVKKYDAARDVTIYAVKDANGTPTEAELPFLGTDRPSPVAGDFFVSFEDGTKTWVARADFVDNYQRLENTDAGQI